MDRRYKIVEINIDKADDFKSGELAVDSLRKFGTLFMLPKDTRIEFIKTDAFMGVIQFMLWSSEFEIVPCGQLPEIIYPIQIALRYES